MTINSHLRSLFFGDRFSAKPGNGSNLRHAQMRSRSQPIEILAIKMQNIIVMADLSNFDRERCLPRLVTVFA
jgi:hypothetical protein